MIQLIRLIPALAVFSSAIAFANLQVFPTRIVLSSKQRINQLTLRHQGAKAEKYRISAIFYRMDGTGKLTQVKLDDVKPEEHSVAKMLRFSPREIVLTPNKDQVVKIMMAPTGALEDGEYRAHIHFEPQGMNEEESPKDTGGSGVNMQLQVRVAVAVPVFYRQGQTTYEAKITSPKVVAKNDAVSVDFDLETKGNAFLYGDFRIYVTEDDGQRKEISKVLGFSSYTPKRHVSFPLTEAKVADFSGKKIEVVLSRDPSDGGEVIAQSTFAPIANRGIASKP